MPGQYPPSGHPSRDLSDELAKIRQIRRDGDDERAEAMLRAGTTSSSIVEQAEAARGRRVAEDQFAQLQPGVHIFTKQPRPGSRPWWDNLDARVRPAAELLHRRRHELHQQLSSFDTRIVTLQTELDAIDRALDALSGVEAEGEDWRLVGGTPQVREFLAEMIEEAADAREEAAEAPSSPREGGDELGQDQPVQGAGGQAQHPDPDPAPGLEQPQALSTPAEQVAWGKRQIESIGGWVANPWDTDMGPTFRTDDP